MLFITSGDLDEVVVPCMQRSIQHLRHCEEHRRDVRGARAPQRSSCRNRAHSFACGTLDSIFWTGEAANEEAGVGKLKEVLSWGEGHRPLDGEVEEPIN